MSVSGTNSARAEKAPAERVSQGAYSQLETLTRASMNQPGEGPFAAQAAEPRDLVVLDRMAFRRAGLRELLAVWAARHDLTVRDHSPDAPLEGPGGTASLVLINVGSWAMESGEVTGWVESARSRYPEAAIVILSDREDHQEVVAAFEAGVRGFVPASSAVSMAFQALTFILNGGSFFPPAALLRPQRSGERDCGRTTDSTPGGLTARQQEVLNLLRQGKSNKLIARALSMQEATVKVHVRQIMRKLGVSNRTQAALLASHDRRDLLDIEILSHTLTDH